MSTTLLGILAGLVSSAAVGALLFACAGRWDLPWFWAYLGVWAASALIGPMVVEPGLIKERLRPGPGGRDILFTIAFMPCGAGQFVVAGLDVGRFHWSDSVAPAVQAIGLLAVVVALAVAIWAMAVNPSFPRSSVSRPTGDTT